MGRAPLGGRSEKTFFKSSRQRRQVDRKIEERLVCSRRREVICVRERRNFIRTSETMVSSRRVD